MNEMDGIMKFRFRFESMLRKNIDGKSLVSLDRKIRVTKDSYEAEMLYRDECRKFLRLVSRHAGHASTVEVHKDSGKMFMEFSFVMPYQNGRRLHVFGEVSVDTENREEE